MSAPRLLRLGWLCYVGFVVYGSLLPFEFTPMPLEQAWLQFRHTPFLALGVDERADWVANGVLYLPVGWLTALLLQRARSAFVRATSLPVAWAACLALAVGVEFAQLFFPPRTVSLNDLWAEAIGSALGVAAARPLAHWWRRRSAAFGGRFRWGHRLLEVYLIAYLAFCLFPYDLLLSAPELRHKLGSGAWGWLVAGDETPSLRLALRLGVETVLSLPFGFWLARVRAPRPVGAAAAAAAGFVLGVAIEGAQLFIASGVSQGVSVLTRVVAVPLGVALWQRRAVLHAGRVPRVPRRIVGALGLAYVAALLAVSGWFGATWHGWSGAAETWASLHFLPFYYHYYTTEALALYSLASVSAMYAPAGVLVWIGGGGALAAALAGLVASAAIEAGKLFMQGARPDPSNLLIAAVACALVHHLANRVGKTRAFYSIQHDRRDRPLSLLFLSPRLEIDGLGQTIQFRGGIGLLRYDHRRRRIGHYDGLLHFNRPGAR